MKKLDMQLKTSEENIYHPFQLTPYLSLNKHDVLYVRHPTECLYENTPGSMQLECMAELQQPTQLAATIAAHFAGLIGAETGQRSMASSILHLTCIKNSDKS